MAILFWRGFGIMALLLTAASELISMGVAALFGADVSQSGKAYNGWGLIVAAVVVAAFYRFYIRPKRTKQLQAAGHTSPQEQDIWKYDTLLFIPLGMAPGILLIAGIILTIVNLVNA